MDCRAQTSRDELAIHDKLHHPTAETEAHRLEKLGDPAEKALYALIHKSRRLKDFFDIGRNPGCSEAVHPKRQLFETASAPMLSVVVTNNSNRKQNIRNPRAQVDRKFVIRGESEYMCTYFIFVVNHSCYLCVIVQKPIYVYSVNSGNKPLKIVPPTHQESDADDDNAIRLSYHLHYYALGEHYNQVVGK